MKIQPIGKIKHLPKMNKWTSVEEIEAFLEDNDWSQAKITEFNLGKDEVYLALHKNGETIYFLCHGIEKITFSLLTENLHISSIRIAQKEEGIRLRVGHIRVLADSVELIENV